jgi:hypothetical protein
MEVIQFQKTINFVGMKKGILRSPQCSLLFLTLIAILIMSCNNNQSNSGNSLKNAVDRIKETEINVRKLDSTMHQFEEGMIEASEWAEEFHGDQSVLTTQILLQMIYKKMPSSSPGIVIINCKNGSMSY